MMTTRSTRKPAAKPAAAQPDSDVVSVDVVPPHAVFWDGEQRTGTVRDVPVDTAGPWVRHGWATVNPDNDAD